MITAIESCYMLPVFSKNVHKHVNTFRAETHQLESSIIAEWTVEFGEEGVELSYVDGDGNALKIRGVPKE